MNTRHTNPWTPEIHNKRLAELHAVGLTDDQIGDAMGFSGSTIQKHRCELKLTCQGAPEAMCKAIDRTWPTYLRYDLGRHDHPKKAKTCPKLSLVTP